MQSSNHRISMETFRNICAGKRAFIIGNGPSLKSLDLTKLKDEITFGVNSIFYLFDEIGFKPTFYVVEDKLVAEDRAEEINNLSGMIKIFGKYLDYCLVDREDIIWANVNFDYRNYPDFPHFSTDAEKELWVGGSVTYLCMQLAYFMGFSEVYLIGFDHNYEIPVDAKIEGTVITSNSEDPNHFHPGYFGKGKRWHDPRLDRMEKAYKKARTFFEADGRRIYNATYGGKLEVFPRAEYRELFLKNRTKEPDSNEPEISVIVCTHRNSDLLFLTLKSLQLQTLSREKYEVIVVDNNSLDHTESVVRSFAGIVYIFEGEIGLSRARNAGVQAAHGKVIAFIDDDAEAAPNWLNSLLNGFASNKNVWAVGGKALPIWDAPRPDWLTEDYYRSLSLIDWGESQRNLEWPERIIGVNCSFRKEVFSTIGCFDNSLGRTGNIMLGNEDTEIQQRIHAKGYKVFYTPEAVVYHHVPAARMTKEYFERRGQGTMISESIMALQVQGRYNDVNKLLMTFKEKMRLSELLSLSHGGLSKYKDIHKGQRCVIIGNGPSLNKMDLQFLENEITFGMNKIYLLFDKWKFRPTYYTAVNPLVLEQCVDEILKVDAPKFLSNKGLPFFSYPPEDVMFIESLPKWHFSRDPREGLCEGWTVTFFAMQLAYFMGFNEVVLIGVDHHFVTQGDPNKEVVSLGTDPNHFHPDYFGKGVRWHLPDLERSEKSYVMAKEAFESDGRRIIDATVDGRLSIFPKIDYQDLFFAQKKILMNELVEMMGEYTTNPKPELGFSLATKLRIANLNEEADQVIQHVYLSISKQ